MRKFRTIGLYAAIALTILTIALFSKSCMENFFAEKAAAVEKTRKNAHLIVNSGTWEIMEKELYVLSSDSTNSNIRLTLMNKQGDRLKIIANYGKCFNYIDSLNLITHDEIEFEYFETAYGLSSWKNCEQEWLNYTTIILHKK